MVQLEIQFLILNDGPVTALPLSSLPDLPL